MRVVIAVGGNALLPRGGKLDAEVQMQRVSRLAPALGVLARHHQVAIVHGNGPQVGLLAVESQSDHTLSAPYPLDGLVAETQGLIGYWLQQAVSNESGRPAVTLVTRTVVDADDPAFTHPTKFIGPTYDRAVAEELAARHDWTVRADGPVWRRVVASPEPREILELDAAGRLLASGTTVILGGGGGIPVAYREDRFSGVPAVVDKDLVAALAAEQLDADLFVILTDVPGILDGFGTADEHLLRDITIEDLAGLDLPSGSMGPKAEAVRRFVSATGRRAAIGSLDELAAVVDGRSGTQVVARRQAVPGVAAP